MNLEKEKETDRAIQTLMQNGDGQLSNILNCFVTLYNKNRLFNDGKIFFDADGDEAPFGWDYLKIKTFETYETNLLVILIRHTRPHLCDDDEQLILTMEFKNIKYTKDLYLYIISKSDEDFLTSVENNDVFIKIKDSIPDTINIKINYDA